MSFTPEDRYRGGMGALKHAAEYEARTGQNYYSAISKGHGRPRRPRYSASEEKAGRPAKRAALDTTTTQEHADGAMKPGGLGIGGAAHISLEGFSS